MLFTQDKPYVNHNGGTLRFGPDRCLYISIGDGGLAGDPYDNAQRTDVLLGKVLRIDPTARDAGHVRHSQGQSLRRYRRRPSLRPGERDGPGWLVPPGRPARDLQLGSAQPWQFNFDPKIRRTLYRRRRPERLGRGRCLPRQSAVRLEPRLGPQRGRVLLSRRARSATRTARCRPRPTTTISGDCSITGIGVYRGQESTNLDGIYFNSDFCSGKIYGLKADDSGAWQYQVLLQTGLSVTGSGQDENGELYVTACSCKYSRNYNALDNPGGTVWRIVSADKVPQGAEVAPAPSAEASRQPPQRRRHPGNRRPGGYVRPAGGQKAVTSNQSIWSISPSSPMS